MNTASTSTAEPSASSLSDLVTERPDWESAPDVQITCPHCKTTHWHNKWLASIFPNTPCDPCSESYKARLEESAYQDTISTTKDFLDTFLPVSLQNTDPDKIPDQSAMKKTLAWKPNTSGKGLTLTGPSRSGKTRSLALLLKRLVEKHHLQPMTFFPGEFHVELIEHIRSERNYKRWRNKISSTPILAIDDLFAETLTPRTESAYFEILDSRINNALPTFFTTQFNAKDAANLFNSKNRANAFLNRLNENTTIIPFANQSIFPIKH